MPYNFDGPNDLYGGMLRSGLQHVCVGFWTLQASAAHPRVSYCLQCSTRSGASCSATLMSQTVRELPVQRAPACQGHLQSRAALHADVLVAMSTHASHLILHIGKLVHPVQPKAQNESRHMGGKKEQKCWACELTSPRAMRTLVPDVLPPCFLGLSSSQNTSSAGTRASSLVRPTSQRAMGQMR